MERTEWLGSNRETMPSGAVPGPASVRPDQGNQPGALPHAHRFRVNWQLPSASADEKETGAFLDKNHQRILSRCIISRARETSCVSWSPEVLFLVRIDGSFSFIILGDLLQGKFILKSQASVYPQASGEALHICTLELKPLGLWMEFFSLLFLKVSSLKITKSTLK